MKDGRGQHADWSAAQVRSAVVNTAARGVLKNYASGLPTDDVNVVGAGLENLQAAVSASVAVEPVSANFGGVPSGSGQTRTVAVTLTNLSGATKTLDLGVGAQPSGVSYSVSPATVTLAAGASQTVNVRMSAGAGASKGGKQGSLEIGEGGAPVAHAVLFTLIK